MPRLFIHGSPPTGALPLGTIAIVTLELLCLQGVAKIAECMAKTGDIPQHEAQGRV